MKQQNKKHIWNKGRFLIICIGSQNPDISTEGIIAAVKTVNQNRILIIRLAGHALNHMLQMYKESEMCTGLMVCK